MRFFVGIDPSSLSRSSLALSLIDMETKSIVYVNTLPNMASNTDLRLRLKCITKWLIGEFKKIEERDIDYAIGYEVTVMLGKGGESLNRAIGAILVALPSHRKYYEIFNTQMKVVAGGSGKADKKEIGNYLKDVIFKENKESRELLFNLIASSRFDSIDSIGIGVTAYEKFFTRPTTKPAVKRVKAIKKSNNKG